MFAKWYVLILVFQQLTSYPNCALIVWRNLCLASIFCWCPNFFKKIFEPPDVKTSVLNCLNQFTIMIEYFRIRYSSISVQVGQCIWKDQYFLSKCLLLFMDISKIYLLQDQLGNEKKFLGGYGHLLAITESFVYLNRFPNRKVQPAAERTQSSCFRLFAIYMCVNWFKISICTLSLKEKVASYNRRH